ncbi:MULTISPECIES: hypothetical protein [Sphingobium]|uniref:hypothetical protein n=1 Tax=Sphingobium sp. MI1205 TaxID=407020 RepID=UPI001F37A2ED|nr:hypothetical protein [Sphingobium sp. MI1205]
MTDPAVGDGDLDVMRPDRLAFDGDGFNGGVGGIGAIGFGSHDSPFADPRRVR